VIPAIGVRAPLQSLGLNLDGTIRVRSPQLDPVKTIRDYMLEVMQKRVVAQLSPGRVSAWLLDMKHLFENGPRRTDLIPDKLAADQFTLRPEPDAATVKTLNRAASRSLAIVSALK